MQASDLSAGDVCVVAAGDVVSCAPELARLSGNVARVHHDALALGSRLVYGGYTIGLALHQAVRAFPNILTAVGRYSCDHLAPVREADTLTSTLTVERTQPLPSSGGLADLRSQVRSHPFGAKPADVLDWRFVVALAWTGG